MMAGCLIIAAAGKKGHERQALAVAGALSLVVEVRRVQGSGAIRGLPADTALVVCAGREAIAPGRAIARRTVRPPVAVLQPVMWPGDFDLVWAPLHDRILWPRTANLFRTLTAPSAVTAAERAAGARRLVDAIGPARPVGVLIGGATASHRFGTAEATQLADRLSAFAATHGVRLAVTTSRRTGAAQTAVLLEKLAARHIVVDGEAADASLVYAGIIERAAAFIVTSDSVAMLSDAATTGKPIYGWRLPGGRSKFERFYAGLRTHGALRWFDGSLAAWSYVPLDAAAAIADDLRPRLGLSHAALQHRYDEDRQRSGEEVR